ncbi:hydroxyacid dehydrogenase [Rhizobium sp. RM]|uniref:hydroxyacid dehydrogenase n=1 Tax=Rhizobium sp. RM TaxID=2748079 RepID=UPI00110EB06E|nr:hydroxyacid dehydrogenase [Rhizobium sp. RM]NWJ25322.1 hydroxyacid dehydrogenase [Rhizobium sp. RM]TMV17591.1 hydroxyacid dehydrogenase [Rhizobium sp. Td3]
MSAATENGGGRSLRVMITGAELVEEARQLLTSHQVQAIYAPAYSTSEDLAAIASDNEVDAILVRQGQIDRSVILSSPRLKVIAKHGSGVDNIDLSAASDRGVPVLRALAANAQSVAELAVSLTVSLMKDVVPLNAAVKGGSWPKTKYVGRDLAGAVFGVIGYGEIGQRAASLARGLGMQIAAYDPFASATGDVAVSRDLDAVLKVADVVSLHCPLMPQTHHLINAEKLALMKPTAFLVNTARGAVVDEAALIQALRSETIAGAALDSFEIEPPAADNPLWSLPNVIATPHVGGASRSALRNMAVQSAQHIIDVLEGRSFDDRALANRDLIAAA